MNGMRIVVHHNGRGWTNTIAKMMKVNINKYCENDEGSSEMMKVHQYITTEVQ